LHSPTYRFSSGVMSSETFEALPEGAAPFRVAT